MALGIPRQPGFDPMAARRRSVVRDIAAKDALIDWKREAARQLLTPQDARRMAPALAKRGMDLEAKARRQRERARREEIRAAANRVEQGALRKRGLTG